MTPAPPTGEREGARERLREALEGFIAVHVEDGVCGPESSAKAEGGPEWCGWCEDAREALALDATSPAAYCAPCGRALTEEEVMCVDCASDAAPAQPGEGEPSADEGFAVEREIVRLALADPYLQKETLLGERIDERMERFGLIVENAYGNWDLSDRDENAMRTANATLILLKAELELARALLERRGKGLSKGGRG